MKLLSIAALVAALSITATLPAGANQLNDWKAIFDNHCSQHGFSLSCSVSHEHKTTVDNPDVVISVNVSRGPVESICGFEQINPNGMKNSDGSRFCVADFTSWMTTSSTPSYADGGTHDEFICTTKTGTISLIPLHLSASQVTVAGHCH